MAFSTKGTIKRVAPPKTRASFVLGSRPPDIRAPAPGRIKPVAGQTQYGKQPPVDPGFGMTGQTGET